MKRNIFLLCAASLLAVSSVSFAAPREDTYSQSVSAVFDFEDDAKTVEAQILPFPGGKKIAFSTRWDDTNPKHMLTANMLAERGLFATCYLVGADFNKSMEGIARKILAMGGAMGSHCISHPNLPTLMPNEIFREIALERARLEARLDTNVVGFVLPYVASSSALDPNINNFIGYSIINSGYRANPEPREDFKKRYAIAKSPVLPSFTFSIGDRDPKLDVFLERMKAGREGIKDGADPHITLGIHSWQDDEARARLGKYIDEVKSGEFWYCNENDYAAYRTQTLHAKIKKFGVSGKTAVFELRRPPATTLGSDIPLSIVFGKAPKAVFLGKTRIMPENGEYKIAHYENWKTPKKIDLINFSKSAGQTLESKKFPGLEFAFSFDRAAGKIFLSAGGSGFSKVSGFRAKWVVPPFYEAPIDGLLHKGGGKLSARLKPFKGAQKWGYSPDDGNMLVMAECDFVYEGKPARVWLVLTDPRGVAKADCARDRALHLGAFDGAKNDFAAFAKFSDPNSALEDFEGLKWQIKSSPAFREFTVNFNGFSSEYRKYSKSKFSYLVCADFVAPRDGKYDFLTAYHCVGALFVNGEKAKPSYKKITLKKGVNRVLMVLNNEAMRINTPLFAVSDGGKLLKVLTPKTR